MYTEEEAKTRWCPFVRCDGNNRHWGSSGDSAPISRCIGSACMAWRARKQWKITEESGWTEYQPFDPEVKPKVQVREVGFCGLAGQP